jgi:hypothetical protein
VPWPVLHPSIEAAGLSRVRRGLGEGPVRYTRDSVRLDPFLLPLVFSSCSYFPNSRLL